MTQVQIEVGIRIEWLKIAKKCEKKSAFRSHRKEKEFSTILGI